MVHSPDASWRVYLTAQQVVIGLLFAMLASARPWRWAGLAGFTWSMTQAVDEWTNGNLWKEQQWEYPLALALILAAWLATKTSKQ